MKTLTPQIIQRIKAAVADVFGLEEFELDSISRKPQFAEARFAYRALSYELTDLSSLRLGREFQCDHGSILLAVRRVKDLSDTDPVYRGKCGIVRSMISLPPVQPMHQGIAA